MSEQYERLVRLLKELFQIDQAELDFGIYRIMNQKADEISRFLDEDLLPQVREGDEGVSLPGGVCFQNFINVQGILLHNGHGIHESCSLERFVAGFNPKHLEPRGQDLTQ